MFQLNVFARDIAKIVEGFPQDTKINVFFLGAASVPENANNGNLVPGLLRASDERPRRSRASERGYELPSSNPDCHLDCVRWDYALRQNITHQSVGL